MLKAKIQDDLRKNLKEGNSLAVSVLRLLLAAILNKEKEKRYKLAKGKPELKEEDLTKGSELTDEETMEVIFSERKKRKESILEFEKGKRLDLVEKEKKETEILQRYLQEQLSEEEVERLVKEVIKKIGAKDIKDLGQVIKETMPKVKGRAEGQLVSKIAREALSKKN